jgi:uncharacterized membrane protein
MISWWWVPASLAGLWLVFIAVGVLTDREMRDQLMYLVTSVAAAPLLLLVAILTRVDVGAVPLDPRALARFAQMRTVDKRPAWVFFVLKRGVIIIRKWDVVDVDGRSEYDLHPRWQGLAVDARKDADDRSS